MIKSNFVISESISISCSTYVTFGRRII